MELSTWICYTYKRNEMKEEDRAKIVRDVGEMLQNLGGEDLIDMQVKLSAFHQYLFDIWQSGYDEAQKTAWIKIKN